MELKNKQINTTDTTVEKQTEKTDYQSQIDKLVIDVKALNDEIYKNNFTAHQDFNKTSNFTTVLKIPHYNELPIVSEVGEILELNGTLYICSSPNTWTIVGTQS